MNTVSPRYISDGISEHDSGAKTQCFSRLRHCAFGYVSLWVHGSVQACVHALHRRCSVGVQEEQF